MKARSEFPNVWGEYKNHGNPYIQGTTVPVECAARGEKYRKPHLLISVDHTQIITQLVVLIITKMKNKREEVRINVWIFLQLVLQH